MITIVECAHGVILPVRAQPGARREGIVGEQAGGLKIAVTAPPDRGRANEAIIELLSDSLGIAKSSVKLVGGQTSRAKKILIAGMTLADVQSWLARVTAQEAD